MPRILDGLSRLLPRRASGPDAKASAAGPLIAWDPPGQPVWSPRDYSAFAREGFMQNAIVYRCVRMIAEGAASVPLLLYEGEEEITEHALLDLIAQPSPDHTSADFLECWYGFLLVAGNAYVEAVGIGGRLRELHVLRPDRMKVIPGPDGWPEAYEYCAGGSTVRFAEEPAAGVRPILHVRLFHPVNDHYGMSPIEAAATSIDLHNTASAWNKALLDNAARPSGALIYAAKNGVMTGEQFSRLKGELELSFQGARNAGRPLLLEGGLDWKPLSLSPKDMDFVEAKHAAAREIALALGVPPMLLGIPGDNTYSNYQEAQRAFWRATVLPLIGRMTKAFSAWLSPAYGGGLELRPDLDQVEGLSGEREALWARLDKATFLTIDEKRAAVGYGPLPRAASTAPPAAFGDGGPGVKFSADQQRVPAGSSDGGQWTSGGGSGGVRLAQAEDSQESRVDILEEDRLGGHTFERHVNKPEEYLKARVLGSRRNIPFIVSYGEKRAGSFTSLEAANKLANATISQNRVAIEAFVAEKFPYLLSYMYVYADFESATGYEAYAPNDRAQPIIRPTYGVTVHIIRSANSKKGYYVFRAYPANRD